MKTNSYPIDQFKIKGVHGYKDITMNMKGKTTIFVSENGAGKTTIINALRAVIECDYFALSEIRFNEIEIKFNGKSNLITIKKDDLPTFRSIDPESIIVSNFNLEERIFNRYPINRKDKELDFYDISNKILKLSENFDEYQLNPTLQHLYLMCPLMDEDFKEALKKSKEELLKNFSNITVSTFEEIREQFSDYTIMYLPTYRRVEKNSATRRARELRGKDPQQH